MTYFVLGWGFQTLAMIVFSNARPKQVVSLFKSSASFQLILLGLLRTFAGLFIAIAFKESDNSSLITSIASYKAALILVGSYFLLKEKDNMLKKIISVALATIGLGLLL